MLRTKVFTASLEVLQPSQLYVSAAKLARFTAAVGAARVHEAHPLPLKRLDDDIILTDGHTRALAALLGGATHVRAVWDEDDLDWDAYAICVGWCKAESVRWIGDLRDRIVDARTYERMWLDRCREMQEVLASRRDP